MRDYLVQIKEHTLFSGIKEDDLNAMLSCLGSYVSNCFDQGIKQYESGWLTGLR